MEKFNNTTDTLRLPTIIHKSFEIDFDKVKNIKDVILILKSMNLLMHWYSEDCPEIFKEIYEKGFLKQVK